MKPDIEDKFKAPGPTKSELKLRSILRSKNIAFKDGQVIWYTGCDKYTPDLIIARKLIIEVDGKIHDQEFLKTPDRIRQRALENMGYHVFRVKNEQIQDMPDAVAEDIIQKYYEVVDAEDRVAAKITRLKESREHESIPKEIDNNLQFWALEFNKELDDTRWSIDYFRKSLTQFHPKLAINQCAMERLILLLLGINLHKGQGDTLDFEYSSNLLKKGLEILRDIFGQEEGNMAAIHLKNMYNISAPGFFKNLIFKGGPNLKPGVIQLKINLP